MRKVKSKRLRRSWKLGQKLHGPRWYTWREWKRRDNHDIPTTAPFAKVRASVQSLVGARRVKRGAAGLRSEAANYLLALLGR